MPRLQKRPLADLKYIVIHHSATPTYWTVHDLRDLHVDVLGYADVGYHYVQQINGFRVGRPIMFPGAHTLGEINGYTDMNWQGIGYCIIGDYSKAAPAEKIINEICYNIKRIARKYKIPLDRKHIIGHRSASRTICPGPYTMEAIYEKLGI